MSDIHWLLLVDGAEYARADPDVVLDGPYFSREEDAVAAAKRAEKHHGNPVRLFAARVVYATGDIADSDPRDA